MILDVSRLEEDGVEFDRETRLPALRAEDGSALVVGQARLRGRARPGALGVELAGTLEAVVRQSCSRCLEVLEIPLRIEFSLLAVNEASQPAAGEVRVDKEDAALLFVAEGRVDLEAVAEEQIHLGLPLKPVCSADCRGLCPTCGKDRNRLECGCRDGGIDPRLAPLARLKESLGGR